MATHAHNSAGSGDPVSAAKITAYSGIAIAIIGLIGTIVGLMVSHNSDNPKESSSAAIAPTAAAIAPTAAAIAPTAAASIPTPSTITPTLPEGSDRGSISRVVINPTQTGVTVSGSAEKDVTTVFVVVGPKPSGGYSFGQTKVVGQRWQADVTIDPPWGNYAISAFYYVPSGGAPSQNPVKFTFQGTEPTTPPPLPTNRIADCAVQHGPDCFTGPGWGPPSVIQPNQ